ncbi:MAG: hypothetical protein MJ094_05350 [Saccharofermentans sp.]|nr:hypothetical protein [Saccharofermentans sp.]
MKKFINVTTLLVLLCMLATMACGCSGKSSEEEIEIVDESVETEVTAISETTSIEVEETSATVEATTSVVMEADAITDEMAMDAIMNRCCLANSDFASLGADHWVIVSSTDSQVVVLFTSYTAAQIRYYIDRATGDTSVTELVPGIIDEEQATDETFNVRDFLTAEIYG